MTLEDLKIRLGNKPLREGLRMGAELVPDWVDDRPARHGRILLWISGITPRSAKNGGRRFVVSRYIDTEYLALRDDADIDGIINGHVECFEHESALQAAKNVGSPIMTTTAPRPNNPEPPATLAEVRALTAQITELAAECSRAAAAHFGDRLTWTRERPTKPGWYWMRHNPQSGVHIVKLSGIAPNFDIEWAGHDDSTEMRCTNLNGEWAGPIPEPTNVK